MEKITLQNGPDVTPVEAVAAALKNVDFDEKVPKNVWVEVKITAMFQATGAVFLDLTAVEAKL